MEICGKYISTEVIEEISCVLEQMPGISRGLLSRMVCERLSWRSRNGRLQEVGCRKVLLELDRRGVLHLPRRDKRHYFKGPREPKNSDLLELPELRGTLAGVGAVRVIPVPGASSNESRIWNALMDGYHYLGKGPLCGAQIRYLVHSSHGWLGGMSFSAATWLLKPRDKWIGWSDRAHRANLEKVVCNSRFLIVPTVRVSNLASHVLTEALRRLGDDWSERYGYRPVLVETFVDPKRFKGTCYRAANWRSLGETAGRATPYPNGKVSDGPKEIFVYPLVRRWRSILCREPSNPLGTKPRPDGFADWAEEEFASIDVYDSRLKARLFGIARDFLAQPGAPIPQALQGSQSKAKGAYRFFDNERITMQGILKAHKESTVERMKSHSLVFAVQDTTTLNYSSHHTTEGLGPIGTKSDPSRGLIVHDTMAFTSDGTPLGLLDVQCWARDPADAGKRDRRKELPIGQKESIKWLNSYRAAAEVQALCPETMVVSVGDREADIYELFAEAACTAGGPKLLVRAERSRSRKVKGSEPKEAGYLWEKMAQEPLGGEVMIHIPRRGSRRARDAKLEVRFAPVELVAPRGKSPKSLKLWVVYAVETGYAADVKEPVEWMLLTDVETSTFEQATERLRWYAGRWNIEVYHRILKSGCHIEDRFLGTAERLENCLAIDMVVAWRIHCLTKMGREAPDIACDVLLTEEEWKILWACKEHKPPPERPPSLSWCVLAIASLGGFLGRKGDGHPGATVIWRGLLRLHYMVIGLRHAHLLQNQRDGP